MVTLVLPRGTDGSNPNGVDALRYCRARFRIGSAGQALLLRLTKPTHDLEKTLSGAWNGRKVRPTITPPAAMPGWLRPCWSSLRGAPRIPIGEKGEIGAYGLAGVDVTEALLGRC